MSKLQFSKTWWGRRFIEALESFSDSARLGRGRSYARNGKVKSYQIEDGVITAKVRGSVNPYFGVYKEPTYNITIEIQAIAAKDWSKALSYIGSNASLVAKLLMNEVPDNIDQAFKDLKINLLPNHSSEFKTHCSCPDWSNPCKHIAGVYYLVAAKLDEDPFLLFELRGLSRQQLKKELAQSELGKLLSSAMDGDDLAPDVVTSYYTEPESFTLSEVVDSREFWLGEKRIPQTMDAIAPAIIPGIVVKKGGDNPAFWQQDHSFLGVMEEFYQRARAKLSSSL